MLLTEGEIDVLLDSPFRESEAAFDERGSFDRMAILDAAEALIIERECDIPRISRTQAQVGNESARYLLREPDPDNDLDRLHDRTPPRRDNAQPQGAGRLHAGHEARPGRAAPRTQAVRLTMTMNTNTANDMTRYDVPRIDYERIAALMVAAGEAGDLAMANICKRALALGPASWSWGECAKIIRESEGEAARDARDSGDVPS